MEMRRRMEMQTEIDDRDGDGGSALWFTPGTSPAASLCGLLKASGFLLMGCADTTAL